MLSLRLAQKPSAFGLGPPLGDLVDTAISAVLILAMRFPVAYVSLKILLV